MAEGLLRELVGDAVDVSSAGTDPRELHPLAVKAMAEVGIDISQQTPSHLKEFSHKGVDEVITVCDSAAQSCPDYPNEVQTTHWSVADPAAVEGAAEAQLESFRIARDDLAMRLKNWLSESQGEG